MLQDPLFYLFAIPTVVLLGLGKGGFSGVGALGTPLLTIGIEDPIRAAGILLPIMLAQDVVGVAAFRASVDRFVLAAMLPGAVIGIGLGYLLAARLSADAVMTALGAVSLLFGAYRLWTDRVGKIRASSNSPAWVGTLFGVAAGFTSQIAHAGTPPFQMWVMPRKLARDVLVGTTAIFFAIINWIKVPAYVALDQITVDNLKAAAILLPIALMASLAGVKLVRKVAQEQFYRWAYALMIAVGAKLMLDGLGA